jgi:hypothetical protein
MANVIPEEHFVPLKYKLLTTFHVTRVRQVCFAEQRKSAQFTELTRLTT